MEKLKRCSERRMNDKLSLNCRGTERQEGGRGGGCKARRVCGGGGGGVQGKAGVGGKRGLHKGRGYLFVMDKRAGERGKFQSRIDVRCGEGGGGGVGAGGVCACVITREDNGLVSQGRQRTGQSGKRTDWSVREDNRLVNQGRQPTGQSASGGQQMRRQASKQVTFCLYCAVYVIMDLYSFSCSSWRHGVLGYRVKSLQFWTKRGSLL